MRVKGLVLLAIIPLGGCAGVQSALDPGGVGAQRAYALTIGMTLAAIALFCAMMLLAAHVSRRTGRRQIDHGQGMRFILWAGALGPAALLLVLLALALPAMVPIRTAADTLVVDVGAEQYWWRVTYRAPGGPAVASANEVRVPVGRPVAFDLASADVIHSFWIPGLAGKMDMIPGRTNRLVIQATRAGRYRGQCAEFCGKSHALMAFTVVAMEPAAFDRWLAAERRPAVAVSPRGRALFADYGCQGCHAIRGHHGASSIGPDLTHFGSRGSVAAGILPNDRPSVTHFIWQASAIKPGVRMPDYTLMPPDEVHAVADYLQALK